MMDYSTYQSSFTWRYASEEMRTIYSEKHKYEIWRKIWITLAEVQKEAGLITNKEFLDLKKNQYDIDVERILEIEKETRHDVVAAIREYAEKANIGGGKIHLGATSMDITDNTEMLRMKEALVLIEKKLVMVLSFFSEKIEPYRDVSCIGFTHLQPAEPTTVGYRFAFYAQDLLVAYEYVQFVKKTIRGKGLKGAVGTAASYTAVLEGTQMTAEEMERKVMKRLGIEPVLISSQVYSRNFDFLVLTALSLIASSLEKFAADLRILQSPMYGEWSEPFGKKQVGSSAMPFKKNPVNAEKVCSLARYVTHLPNIAQDNAMHSYLERTLDDSANRRSIIPDSFLATEEILITTEKILSGLIINEKRIAYNLNQFAPFAASEAILMESVKNGASRQEMHEVLREIAMIAWKSVQEGKENPMQQLLLENTIVKKYLSQEIIVRSFDVKYHVGNAPQRARKLVKQIKTVIKKTNEK